MAESESCPPIKSQEEKKCRNDFLFGKMLGEGSYSTVILAVDKKTNKEYAIKIIRKHHIVKERKTAQVMREKECLRKLNHPFFIKLYFTFQDTENLYFGLSVAPNGELLDILLAMKQFNFSCTCFYAAQLVEAIQHMHSLNIIHRDLKPENILLDENYNIQITDFGTAKVIEDDTAEGLKSSSFVGTAQYVSPELLKDKQACKSSDLWALGCIIFQMHAGKPPFQAQNEYLTFQLVLKCKYEFPENFDERIKDLVERLLVVDPQERLGSEQGIHHLKNHQMFRLVKWQSIFTEAAPEEIREKFKIFQGQEQGNFQRMIQDFDEAIPVIIPSPKKGDLEELVTSDPNDVEGYGLQVNLSSHEKDIWMKKQKQTEWNSFTNGKLILKCGILEKKRGLSIKLRQFLLIEGPRLVYVDPSTRQVKGEIPWSEKLSVELKTFRIFYVHTPNRTYHLIDKSNNAIKWCKKIQSVSRHYFQTK